MPPRRRPIERTRQYDIWAEHPSRALGPYELVIQAIDEITNDEPIKMRAAYRKDGVMRPSHPIFEAATWVEVIAAAIADPECFSDAHVRELADACAKRLTMANSGTVGIE